MRTKWEIAAAGIGTVAAALAIAGFAIRYLSEDRWVGKLRPLDNRSEDVHFLLTDWCDRLGDVLTFRKGPGRTLERRFRTPAQPIHGGDPVDTGFETIDLSILQRPDGTWVLVQENKDGAQTHYTKASDVSLTEARTDLPGPPARLWRCDATTVR